MKNRALILALLLGVAAVLSIEALADSAIITADVTVPSACGIATNVTNISFGSVNAGATSGERIVQINNTGSVPANITLSGTNWTSVSSSMAVGQTKFLNETSAYGSKTALTTSDQLLQANVTNGEFATLFAQMAVPSLQAAGTYHQNITVSTIC